MANFSPRVLLAGARPGVAAGNSVSTEVLLDALSGCCDVDVLTHNVALIPRLRPAAKESPARFIADTQPLLVHGEAFLSGIASRRRIRERHYTMAWAVNSRYAMIPAIARLPYVIWEATTIRDELGATSGHETRSAGRGSGLMASFHAATLPLDERIERRLYRGSRSLFAMSEHTRTCMLRAHGLIDDRVRVLRHPPSKRFLEAASRLVRGARQPPATSDKPIPLLFVGRVDDPRKNFTLLLDACAYLRASGTPVVLTVIGPYSSRWRTSVQTRLNDLNVGLTGEVGLDRLVSSYRDHALLIVPSRQEGLGIVAVEALWTGLPVVTTACGGPEGIIRESGAGAIARHTAESLALEIRRIACDANAWQTASNNALTFAQRHLSPATFATEVVSVVASASTGRYSNGTANSEQSAIAAAQA